MPAPNPAPPADSLSDPRQFARQAALTYGPWQTLKRLYKDTEAALPTPDADPALFGTLAARLDAVPLSASGPVASVQLGAGVSMVSAVAVVGDTLCCLAKNNYQDPTKFATYRLNPANPLQPTPGARFALPDTHTLLPCGPYVCALMGGIESGALGIFDASDLASPRWRGRLALGGHVRAAAAFPLVFAAVSGTSTTFRGLRVVDVSDPDHPRRVGEVAIPGAESVAADGGPVVLVVSGRVTHTGSRPTDPGGITLVDVSDPTAPRTASFLGLGDAQCAAIQGTTAYVGAGEGQERGLYVFDITDPARPRQVAFLHVYPPKFMRWHAGYLWMQTTYGALMLADVRNPLAPALKPIPAIYGSQEIMVAGETLYLGRNYGGMEIYNISTPTKPARVGSPPSSGTLGYMKRRVRRVLRTLAIKDADAYAALAYETLAAAEGTDADMARQWVTADILYGASDRWQETRHGRGPLAPGPARLRLKAREERAPEAWDKHPELAAALLTNAKLPWQTHEAAYKMLRATRQLPADLPGEVLSAFLWGRSPLLVRFAVSRLAAGDGLAQASAKVAAAAYLKAGRTARLALEPGLTSRINDPDWGRKFWTHLFALAEESITQGRYTRRAATALDTAARLFANSIDRKTVEERLAPLVSAGQPNITALVLERAWGTPPARAIFWLRVLAPLDPALREPVTAALVDAMKGRTFSISEAQELVYALPDLVREAGWRLLERSATVTGVFQTLWTTLLDSTRATDALRTAMASPSALALLDRAGLSADDIAQRLSERPFLAGLLSPQTFAAITRQVPAAVTLALVGAASDEQWPALRDAWLRDLREGIGAAALWLAAAPALSAAADDKLEQRLLGDSDIADTFVGVDDPAVLDIRDPSFGPLLGRWVRAHAELFTPNSNLLLQAATQVLPEVRDWALARVREAEMTLPFALRLLESALPPSVEVGTGFFFGLAAGDSHEQTYALALADSPFFAVRRLGYDFIQTRWDTLAREPLLSALFQSAHPDTQAFVAELLTQSADQPADTPQFDREVLRTRHAARRAKEAVKARQTAAPTLDTATLLSLARGQTPRDRDWALTQLARMAAGGAEIDGVTLEGVAGG